MPKKKGTGTKKTFNKRLYYYHSSHTDKGSAKDVARIGRRGGWSTRVTSETKRGRDGYKWHHVWESAPKKKKKAPRKKTASRVRKAVKKVKKDAKKGFTRARKHARKIDDIIKEDLR